MKTTTFAQFSERMRGFWSAFEQYAEALDKTPYDFLLERVRQLEVEVERLKTHDECAQPKLAQAQAHDARIDELVDRASRD